MGNQLVLPDKESFMESLNKACLVSINQFENELRVNGRKICFGNIGWNTIITLNRKNLDEIYRDYTVIDPANHLHRLIYIWRISSITDICKLIWGIYLELYSKASYSDSICIICTKDHKYLKCRKYRKCTACFEIGHSNDKSMCPNLCSCGENHLRIEHVCEICGQMGHRYQYCARKCPCGKNHAVENHKCHICDQFGHIKNNCPVMCQCGKHHLIDNHKCKICCGFGHLDSDCTELCICGKENKLIQHYCIASKKRAADNTESGWINKKRKY